MKQRTQRLNTPRDWSTRRFFSGQVDDYGMPEAETKLQSPFSRSDTLEQVILGCREGYLLRLAENDVEMLGR